MKKIKLSVFLLVLVVLFGTLISGYCQVPEYLGYWAEDGDMIKLQPCNDIRSFGQYRGVRQEEIKIVLSQNAKFYYYKGDVPNNNTVQLLKLKWVDSYPRSEHSVYGVQLYLAIKTCELELRDTGKNYLFEIIPKNLLPGEYSLVLNGEWHVFRVSSPVN